MAEDASRLSTAPAKCRARERVLRDRHGATIYLAESALELLILDGEARRNAGSCTVDVRPSNIMRHLRYQASPEQRWL